MCDKNKIKPGTLVRCDSYKKCDGYLCNAKKIHEYDPKFYCCFTDSFCRLFTANKPIWRKCVPVSKEELVENYD